MKIRICAALLIAVLTLSLLAGCADDWAERKLDAIEESVERAVIEAINPQGKQRTQTDASLLSVEEAKSIALAHAGLSADQVTFIRAEYELNDRIPHYDIEFREGRWEYEYEIHAETGAFLSVEKDV